MQVVCEHPNIILNPLALELISQHGNYFIRGKEHNVFKSKKVLYAFKKKNLNPFSLHIGINDVDSCFVLNCNTEERYPLYLAVPCGHCTICKHAKVTCFVERCKMETQCYNSVPYFLTLTYDNQHKKETGVCLRDVQLFFKRLRINLYRSGYREKIRYVLVSEYGKRFARPHYHAILWNFQQSDIFGYLEFRKIIEKSWSYGFVMLRPIDPSNDKAFFYTSKYLLKDNHVPVGCEKPFMVCSNRGGSIGATFIDRYADHIINKLDTKFQYLNKWNNKVCSMCFSRYVINRLMPSFCRSLGAYTKSSIRQFMLGFTLLKAHNNINTKFYEEKAKKIVSLFGQYFYCPKLEYSDIPLSLEVDNNQLLSQMLRSEIYIDKALRRGTEFYDKCRHLERRRRLFLDKLFLNQQEVDIIDKAYNIKRFNAASYNRELICTPF